MQRGKCLLLSCSMGQRRNPPAVLVGKHPFRGDNIEASSEKSSTPGQEEGLSDGVLLVCPPQCWGHCFCKDWQGQEPLPACWALSGQQKGCRRALSYVVRPLHVLGEALSVVLVAAATAGGFWRGWGGC